MTEDAIACSTPLRSAPLLIFDFDDTLVDKDSSEWVAGQLGAASLFDDLRWKQGIPWHQAMNTVLRTLHAQGTTIAHIRHALSSLPLPSETVGALKAAHSLGCELHILSDANTFFIESVLAHQGLDSLFTCIHSNPAWIDAKGCLCYSAFHGDTLPPHGCRLCPPNMCKGSILDTIWASHHDPAACQIIYAGDGIGDLCPTLRLIEQDYVLPRYGYPLSVLLKQQNVKARMRPWKSLAATLQETLLDFMKHSGLDVAINADDQRASLPGELFRLRQDDKNTSCRDLTSPFRAKIHGVYNADSAYRRSPYTKCLISKPIYGHVTNHLSRTVTNTFTRTACLQRSAKGLSLRIQASASLVPVV